MTDDDDPGEAFDRAAARLSMVPVGPFASRRNRVARTVRRFALVLFLVPAHVVATRRVTGLLVVHLVLLAIVGTQVVAAWMDTKKRAVP